MENKYIDTHSHPHFPQYDEDQEAMLGRMREQEVVTIAVGTDIATSKQAVKFATEHKDVVLGATIGVHPNDEPSERFDASVYGELLSDVVVGVGECGFDYYRSSKDAEYTRQREVFEAQIAFAVDNNLPLMLHIRPSQGTVDAHDDALEVLRLYQKTHGDTVRGNVHFFTSNTDVARAYLELGFTIAFPGVITFAPELHEVVRDVPLDMMLSETDAPYAAPVPHRGKRNEPVFVVDVIRAIADIRGEGFEKVAAQLRANAERVFLAR